MSGGEEAPGSAGAELLAYFPDADAAAAAREHLAALGARARIEEIEAPRDPFAAFREGLSTFRAGGFWVDPTGGADFPADAPEPRRLRVPAGCAFGTGLHESTRGALEFLERHPPAGLRVLDAGTGSAILAMAAVRQGARACVAFDVDPDAAFEARRNLFRNRLEGKIGLVLGPVASLAGTFDLALANMIHEESAPILPALAGLLAAEGSLVLSGILDAQERAARDALAGAGMRVTEVRALSEWRTIAAQKCPGEPNPSPG